MKNSLEILFGNDGRWRMIKAFLFNENEKLTQAEIAKRNKLDGRTVRSLVKQLVDANFLLSKRENQKDVFSLNKEFPFFNELKILAMRSNIFPQCESLEKIKSLGNVKFAVILGTFLSDKKAKTDMLIVGEEISRARMRQLLEDMEAEMGREVNYSLMDLAEFKYRVNMFDKFIMDVLESPHEIIVNKLEKEIKQLKENRKK